MIFLLINLIKKRTKIFLIYEGPGGDVVAQEPKLLHPQGGVLQLVTPLHKFTPSLSCNPANT